MPVKYKQSHARYDRQTKRTTIEHHYLKAQSIKELLECYNNVSTKPKPAPKRPKQSKFSKSTEYWFLL